MPNSRKSPSNDIRQPMTGVYPTMNMVLPGKKNIIIIDLNLNEGTVMSENQIVRQFFRKNDHPLEFKFHLLNFLNFPSLFSIQEDHDT